MLIPTALIVFLWLAWLSVWAVRKIKRKRSAINNVKKTQELVHTTDVVRAPEPTPWPLRVPREYEVTPANKIDHIIEYVEDGDPRTFDDMFYGDFEHEFVMWVDHGESDDDIVKMCERVLKTGALDGWFDNDTLDLIVDYRGVQHVIEYPNDFADRDTSILGLSKVIQPEFELRYCTASDGSDMAAILPLKPEEWRALEARCGEKLHHYFEPIDDSFRKFGD